MTIQDNLIHISTSIANTARRCGRDPSEVTLIAVTKTQPSIALEKAIAAGASHVGENYIQEARKKIEQLSHLPVQWHLIGHLQTNKAKYAVRMFDLIHTVDSLKLATELNQQARKIGKQQAILIQVNMSGEARKSGISPDKALDLVKGITAMPHLMVRGLMTIGPYHQTPEQSRPIFTDLKILLKKIRKDLELDDNFCELSMGMTGDFEIAIEAGATLIRLGTAIFGERP